ncbi:restriction endonuclease [bacterium]|nr:restriction endonuclease [bacterium]
MNALEEFILKVAYEGWQNNVDTNLCYFWTTMNFKEEEVISQSEIMQHKGVIDLCAGHFYEISPKGILEAENRNYISELEMRKILGERIRILKILNDRREKHGPMDGYVDITDMLTNLNSDKELNNLARTLTFLQSLGYIRPLSNQESVITDEGVVYYRKLYARQNISSRFDSISNLLPKRRGQEFQKLFADVIEQYDWRKESEVRTPHEEIDIVINKNREFYLLECKWQKKKIQSGDIGKLFSRIASRSGTNGIFVSMSDYTSGAIKNIIELLPLKVIIPFTRSDVLKLINYEANFDNLINLKYTLLITKKEVDLS